MAIKFSYKSSGSSPFTVPGGSVVLAFIFTSAAGGTLTIKPNGAGNDDTTGEVITLRAGLPFGRDFRAERQTDDLPRLGADTVFTWTSVDAFYIEMAAS